LSRSAVSQAVPRYSTQILRMTKTRDLWKATALWFGAALLAVSFTSLLFVVAMITARDRSVARAFGMTAPARIDHLSSATSYDSWLPMLKAYQRNSTDPSLSPYSVFFEGQGKFQYPPTTLLFVEFLPRKFIDEAIHKWEVSELRSWNDWLCRLAVFITVFLALAILHAALEKALGHRVPLRQTLILSCLVVLAALMFHPFIVGYELGQIQLVLNAFVAGGLLCYLREKRAAAGFFLGLCCLVKPQYLLILIWSLLRRDRRFTAGFLFGVVPIFFVSFLRFGLSTHLDYANVLGILARNGEVFWYNQSLNGLLHRLIDPGAACYYDDIGSPLPPYRWGVHLASTLFGLCVIIWALAVRLTATRGGSVIDLAVIIVAVTVASPISWNHHYGALFPVFVAVLPSVLLVDSNRTLAILLGAAYLAIGFEVVAPDFMFRSRWLGLLSSHIFFGGLLLLSILVVARGRYKTPPIAT
jgi:alpha-1,2-mannosyltransferase